jgi:hypothetical protein
MRAPAWATEATVAEDSGRSDEDKLRSLEDDADLLGDEPQQDVLFQMQMSVANAFLGHWKVLLYLAGGILIAAAVYGGYDSHIRSEQQAGHEAVARAERGLEDLTPELSEDDIKALFADVATKVEEAGASTTGTARAYAFVRAAQYWMQIDDADAARKAWSQAAAVQAPGTIGWSASMGAARAAADAEDYATALHLIGPAAGFDGLLGEEAVFTRLQIEVLSGNAAAAGQSAAELEARFPKSGRIAEAKGLAAGVPG